MERSKQTSEQTKMRGNNNYITHETSGMWIIIIIIIIIKFRISVELIAVLLASHRGGPGSHPGSMWGLWWTKRHWGTFSQSTSVSPANHSTNFSLIIITPGWHNRPISGRSAELTQLDSTPHYSKLKKN
jgi:hypothetical protein